LCSYIELKRTPIVVVNQVDYLPEAEWLSEQGKLKAWLEGWRTAWSSKDLDGYMALYSDQFRANNMSKSQWRRYKQTLANRYSFIDINLKDVQIFVQGPKIVVRFLQMYKSDQKNDVGDKILYALRVKDKLQIIGENWEVVPENFLATSTTPNR
jgi:hypothetical protein